MGFIILITFLFGYLIIGKILSGHRAAQKKIFFQNLEDAFLPLIVLNDDSEANKILGRIKPGELENFIEFISIYLSNIKGDDFERIITVLYKSPLFKNLCDLTLSKDIEIKLYSIYCLGLMKRPACIDNLLAGLQDTNFFVRMASVKAIAQTGCLHALDSVLETLSKEKLMTSYKLSETLWHFGEDICPYIFKALQKRDGKIIKTDSDDLLTSALIELSGYFKYFDAAGEIHQILKETSKISIIKSCIYSLGKMVYTEAAADIETHLDSGDAEVRLSAVKAVFEFRSTDKIDKLKELLNDPDWNVRYNSGLALYEMNFDFQSYMFGPGLAGQEMARAYRTIVHILTEKHSAEEELSA
jgi:HEAT repeat protein